MPLLIGCLYKVYVSQNVTEFDLFGTAEGDYYLSLRKGSEL